MADHEITELVRLATLAPSAYHFQSWKFIAVREAATKTRLHALAFRQQKVLDAPVTVIVCGTLAAHEGLAEALQPAVDAGIFDQDLADGWQRQATSAHLDNPQLQRDEAIGSASLAAMTLMLAAQGMECRPDPLGALMGTAWPASLASQEMRYR